MFCFYQYFETSKWQWFYTAIWLLGASVVIRPTLTYFTFGILIIIVLKVLYGQWQFKKIIIIALLLFSTIGVQMLNMYRCCNRLKVSYIGETAWYLYFGAYSINIMKYPNQTLDFYNKEREKELTCCRKDEWAIFDSKKEDTAKLSNLEKKFKTDIRLQLAENKKGIIFTFFRNLISNSMGGSLLKFHGYNSHHLPIFDIIQNVFFRISQLQNILNSLLILFILPFLLAKQYVSNGETTCYTLNLSLYTWFLAFCILIFSSISFGQGDRFHVVTIPLTLFSIVPTFFSKKVSLQPILKKSHKLN